MFNWLSLLKMILLYPLGFFNPDPKSLPQEASHVTILVHGFIHNRSAWHYLIKDLSEENSLGPIFTINLGHPFQSIDAYAKQLAARILEIKAMTGNPSLEANLVGHSMGGLVCLKYACQYAEKDGIDVKKIVTVASPLQGTPVAKLAMLWSEAGRNMLPHSQFVKELQQEAEQLKGKTAIYSITCGKDCIVPAEYAFLNNSEQVKEFPSYGHFAPLDSPELASQIIAWLKA